MTLFGVDEEEVAVVVADAPIALSRPDVTTGAVDDAVVVAALLSPGLLPSSVLFLLCLLYALFPS